MFKLRFQLHTTLLDNIVRIKTIIARLNDRAFSEVVLAQFERDGRAVSAYASTSIEGNPLPLTDVRKILKSTPRHIRDTEREVLNYNEAMEYLNAALQKKTPLTTELINMVQAMVTKGLIAAKDNGRLRRDPVVVNNPKTRSIAFIPPDAKDVPRLLSELVQYVQESKDTIDPLIVAGVFHRQFVVIHPFIDGNGRTARLMTKYILASIGLNTFNLFSFENYYNKNITKYFSAVGLLGDYYEIEHGIDFTDWLIYFTDGIIDELLRVQKLLEQTVTPEKISDVEKSITTYIQKHGSITIREYNTITTRAHSTQILDLKKLVDKGILQRNAKGKATYYTLVLT